MSEDFKGCQGLIKELEDMATTPEQRRIAAVFAHLIGQKDDQRLVIAEKDAEIERLRAVAAFSRDVIRHLLHNIKASGRRIDLGLAKELALDVIGMIDEVMGQPK